MSRTKAKEELSLAEFQTTMSGVYSTTVGIDTLDEAPMAYKPIESIVDNIKDTVDIMKILKPIYNFKAGE
jgi:RNA-splicing ligase RtcB